MKITLWWDCHIGIHKAAVNTRLKETGYLSEELPSTLSTDSNMSTPVYSFWIRPFTLQLWFGSVLQERTNYLFYSNCCIHRDETERYRRWLCLRVVDATCCRISLDYRLSEERCGICTYAKYSGNGSHRSRLMIVIAPTSVVDTITKRRSVALTYHHSAENPSDHPY